MTDPGHCISGNNYLYWCKPWLGWPLNLTMGFCFPDLSCLKQTCAALLSFLADSFHVHISPSVDISAFQVREATCRHACWVFLLLDSPLINTLLEHLLIWAEELKYVIHTEILFPTELRKVAFPHPIYCFMYFLKDLSVISQFNITHLVMILFHLESKVIIFLTSNCLWKGRLCDFCSWVEA